MKWLRRLIATRRSGSRPAVFTAVAIPPSSRVVLRFRDGSATILDPDSETAVALHTVARRLRTGQ